MKKVLVVSSPIGLGHVLRDLAIVRGLRTRHEIDVWWLAQHPVTVVLQREREKIHAASSALHSEADHFARALGEHSLPVLSAFVEAASILSHNFEVFRDLTTSEPFDLVLCDEAWEVDLLLPTEPKLKRWPLVWLSDFFGAIAMNESEEEITVELNRISAAAASSGIYDELLFVGEREHVRPGPLAEELPPADEFVGDHFNFVGYIHPDLEDGIGDSASAPEDRGKLVVATVGGSGAGRDLLAKTIAAYHLARGEHPDLRMMVVTGPRIGIDALPKVAGVSYEGYVHRLDQRLRSADAAVIQGGLATAMELGAAGVPFVYVPLKDHFEQQLHVPYRLEALGIGKRMEYDQLEPESMAEILVEMTTGSAQRVERGSAQRAIDAISELL